MLPEVALGLLGAAGGGALGLKHSKEIMTKLRKMRGLPRRKGPEQEFMPIGALVGGTGGALLGRKLRGKKDKKDD